MLGAEQSRDAWTRLGGPSEPARGPAHCHPPQGACRDLRTCSALWVMPQHQSVPGTLGVTSRAVPPSPAGLAGIARRALLWGKHSCFL